MGGGHYTAYICYEYQNERYWLYTSDSFVERVDERQVLQCEAYILFYRKIELWSEHIWKLYIIFINVCAFERSVLINRLHFLFFFSAFFLMCLGILFLRFSLFSSLTKRLCSFICSLVIPLRDTLPFFVPSSSSLLSSSESSDPSLLSDSDSGFSS